MLYSYVERALEALYLPKTLFPRSYLYTGLEGWHISTSVTCISFLYASVNYAGIWSKQTSSYCEITTLYH